MKPVILIIRLSLITTAVLIVSLQASSQETSFKGPNFDIQDFNKKFETVQWLVQYDEVAWKTSEVVMNEDKTELAKLGKEWFCYQDKNQRWHAIYGKLNPEGFAAVFHYFMGPDGKVTKTNEKADQVVFDCFAKALVTAHSNLDKLIPANSPLFNQYIRRNADETFDVWMLPAFQRDGTAVYGAEAHCQIDTSGEKILKQDSYIQKNFRGFKTQPPREIVVDYSEIEKPTLAGIFFVWYYKSYFSKIHLDTAKSSSTVIDTGKDGYMWVHVDKTGKK